MIELYVFTAKWCKHCGGIQNAIQDLPVDSIQKYDADEDFQLCLKYNIEYLPTILLLKDKQEIRRFNENVLHKDIEEAIEELKNEKI